MSMERTINIKENSFDILRGGACLSVILLHYTHYALLYGNSGESFISFIRRMTGVYQGVVVLFAISGFLISMSLDNSKSAFAYLKKRFMRLVPSYYTQTIINIILLLIIARNFIDSSLVKWFLAQLVFIGYTPDSLKGFATGSVNGALWSIPVEIQLYILLLLTYKLVKRMNYKQWSLVLIALSLVNLYYENISNLFSNGALRQILGRFCAPYTIWFAIGAFCYFKREKVIPVLKNHLFPLGCLYFILEVVQLVFGNAPGYYTNIFQSLLLPFLIIGLAFKFGSHRIRYECSYSIYLYHWLILNVFVSLEIIANTNWLISLIAFVLCSWFVGFVFHILIEKNALKRKTSR